VRTDLRCGRLAPALLIGMLALATGSCRVGRSATSKTASTAKTEATATTVAPPSDPTSSAPVAPGSPVAGKVIVIDPGHDGGNGAHPRDINRKVDAGGFQKECDTTGTETDDGYTESRFNLQVAQQVADKLRQAGATVVLTRSSDADWGPCIDQRAAIGNQAHADVAVSVHADGGPVGGRGFHVIYPPDAGRTAAIGPDSKRLAVDLRDSYEAATGLPRSSYLGTDGLDVRTDLGGLNLSTVPKAFIECGNMRNPVEARLLVTDAFQTRVATGIFEGLSRYLAGS